MIEHYRVSLVLLLIPLLLLSGCDKGSNKIENTKKAELKAPAPDTHYFQEIGQEIGLDFTHSIGATEMKNIVESVGGGAAFLDVDKDGHIDLFACSGTWIKGFSKTDKPENIQGNRLYRNLGDGTYEDITRGSGVDGDWYSMGVTVGDYDNDGYPDLYLSNYGENVLLRNQGDGTFSDETQKAGVAGGKACSVGAVWFDYDNDGLLDLYVGNYLNFDPEYDYYYAPDGFPGPLAYDAQPDQLFHNEGNNRFTDVTEEMGIVDIDGRAMGVGAADYDEDGYVDIFVANDHTVNYLWHNDQGKGFTDRATMSGTGFSQGGEATVSMSVDYADYNKDQLLDIFISDDNYCSLYQNIGGGVFVDNSYASGISVASGQFVGWSSSFLDYDNDGDPDLFKTNGELKHLYGQEDQLFDNNGDGTFSDISVELSPYFKEEYVGRGACLGDYDNDGDIDIFIVNLHSGSKFLRNNRGNENHWLALDLIGTTSNRDAIGARVKVIVGDDVQITQKKSTTGYLSQNDHRLFFGIGEAEQVDSVEIIWPSGKTQRLEAVSSNQLVTVTEAQ